MRSSGSGRRDRRRVRGLGLERPPRWCSRGHARRARRLEHQRRVGVAKAAGRSATRYRGCVAEPPERQSAASRVMSKFAARASSTSASNRGSRSIENRGHRGGPASVPRSSAMTGRSRRVRFGQSDGPAACRSRSLGRVRRLLGARSRAVWLPAPTVSSMKRPRGSGGRYAPRSSP